MRRVPQKAVLRTEYLLRTRGGGFRYRISLPYQKSLFFTPNALENASRTIGACFAHRAHIPYHRRPSPVPNEPNAKNAKCHKCRMPQIPGKKGLFQYSSTDKFPTNARKKVSSPDSTTGNPTNTREKRALPI